MTVTSVCERPTIGAAPTGEHTVPVGRYADGRTARLTLGGDGRSGGRAEHITVYGDTRTGVSTTLRNIGSAAIAAGWNTTHVDPVSGCVGDCRAVLSNQHDLARAHLLMLPEDRQPTLLVIDNLQDVAKSRQAVEVLIRLAAIAGRAGITVLTGTHDVSPSSFGGRFKADATLTRAALTQTLLTLRVGTKPSQQAALTALGVPANMLPGLAALPPGVGCLPRISQTRIFVTPAR